MKLLFCSYCGDVQKFTLKPRTCECGKARGRCLEDGLTVEVNDAAIVLAIDNYSLRDALQWRKIEEPREKRNFTAWVFTPDYERIKQAA